VAAVTQLNHYERINLVQRHIREHLGEALDRVELARRAGFSVPHFHRIFAAHVGENIGAYVRRARMEHAAQQLLAGRVEVTDIALTSGYETPSAFAKAFKQFFGISPTEFRALEPHVATHLSSRHLFYNRKRIFMQPKEICLWPDVKALYARTSEVITSPAFQTAPREAMSKLMSYVMANHTWAEVRHVIAIYPDDPEVGKEARCDVGVIFVDGIEPLAPEGLAYQTLPGGRWAIFRHVGPYDTLWQTWQTAYRDWLPTSGCELRDAFPFEDYLDDMTQVAPAQLPTDIYIPIK
jgi:AraC family transcriptional regulator